LETFTDLVEARFAGGVKCPLCGHGPDGITKHGTGPNGKQRHRCGGCGRTFSATTNTLLSSTKKDISTWQLYITCMARGLPLAKAAEVCDISIPTAFAWRHKILDALRRTDDVAEPPQPGGTVEADETFLPLSFKGRRPEGFEYPKGRRPRRRGREGGTRGLAAAEQVAVGCAAERFLRPFNGVATKYLDNYLAWNAAMSEYGAGSSERRTSDREWCRALRSNGHTRDFEVSSRPEVPPICAAALEQVRAVRAEGAGGTDGHARRRGCVRLSGERAESPVELPTGIPAGDAAARPADEAPTPAVMPLPASPATPVPPPKGSTVPVRQDADKGRD
jgi:transposase-like protein